jgi:glutaminyl-peptide cyclotransferase
MKKKSSPKKQAAKGHPKPEVQKAGRNTGLWVTLAVGALVLVLAYGFQQGEAGGSESVVESAFDGARAFRDLETVVGFGPRPAGSETIVRTRDYIVAELEAAGFEPELDEFVATTPTGPVNMVNIRAVKKGQKPGIIAVTGHYDTKLFDFPFVGANDGGSSTAILLEMARVADGLRLEHTLEFIFFDGEEAVKDWTATDSVYGSRYDIDRRFDNGTLRQLKALVLVDMVGDTDLRVLKETASTDWLKTIIWDVAQSQGYGRHFGAEEIAIEDDHIPYLNAGIPAVDIIDFDYPYWHTAADTLDKTSAESLKVIGDVVLGSLPAIDAYLNQ